MEKHHSQMFLAKDSSHVYQSFFIRNLATSRVVKFTHTTLILTIGNSQSNSFALDSSKSKTIAAPILKECFAHLSFLWPITVALVHPTLLFGR